MKSTVLVAALCLFSILVPAVAGSHDPNDFWVPDSSLPIIDIHGSSATNVWALDSTNVYLRTGDPGPVPNSNYQPVPHTLPSEPVDLFVLSATLVYAIHGPTPGGAELGFYAFCDITDCNLGDANDDGAPFQSVWASSGSDIWFTGQDSVVRDDGTSGGVSEIFAFPGDPTGVLQSRVFGFSSTDVWMVSTGRVFHYTGGALSSIAQTGTVAGTPSCLWGSSSTNLYVCASGEVYRSTDTGVTWVQLTSSTPTINGVWGSSATDIWGIGASNDVFHSSDGVTFTPEPDPIGSQGSFVTPNTWTGLVVFPTVGFLSDDGRDVGVLGGSTSVRQPGSWKLQINAAVSNPPTATNHDVSEFQITSSHAQCNGDETSFSINMDDGPPDAMNVTIIDTDTNTNLLLIVQAQMFNVGSHAYYFNRILPPGDYVAYAFQDPPGIVTPSRFDSTAFNVPVGTCLDTPFDSSGLAALIVSRTNQTNSYVNSTSEAILENLTSVHVHIDSHFNMTDALIVNQFFQTNGYVNTTRIQILDAINDLDFNIDCGNETGNCTFEAQTMIDLPGLTDQQVGAFLLFLTMLIISFFQRWLFVAIASVIGILEVFILGGIFGFEFTGLLLVIGIMLQIFVDHRDAMLEKRAKEEGGELGD